MGLTALDNSYYLTNVELFTYLIEQGATPDLKREEQGTLRKEINDDKNVDFINLLPMSAK